MLLLIVMMWETVLADRSLPRNTWYDDSATCHPCVVCAHVIVGIASLLFASFGSVQNPSYVLSGDAYCYLTYVPWAVD